MERRFQVSGFRLQACLTLMLCAGSVRAGGEGRNTDYFQFTPAQNRAMNEAPMLAGRVKRGELDPLEKRLPANPLGGRTAPRRQGRARAMPTCPAPER